LLGPGFLIAPAAPGQSADSGEVEAIRQEMRQMRADYERRMQLLEQRLAQIGNGTNAANPAPPPATAGDTNALPAAVDRERGQAFANLQFHQSSGTSEMTLAQNTNSVVKRRIEQVLNDYVDFGGYFRAGYGRDDKGGPQPAFQAPGAFAKYRLGNEAENYGELMVGKNWYVPDIFSTTSQAPRPDGTPDGPIARAQVRMAFYDPYSSSGGNNTDVTLPEAWASIGNVFAGQPEVKFWAGNRFYRRQDICINDFFFYNMSGAGGGVEDYEINNGKLALAWIGNGAQSGVYSSDIVALPDPNNQAGFSKQSFDLSLYDVEMPLGKGEFALVFASENSGKDAAGQQAPDSQGVAFTFLHTHEHFLSQDGVNRFSLQIGNGAAKTFTSGYETTTLTNGTFIVPDDSSSWRFRATESFVADLNPHFSISPALVYQYTDYHNSQGNVQWLSAGVRPVYHFNKNFGLAFESGVDHVADEGPGQNGTLYKITLAPEVSLGNKFFSRPVLRAYVTYAAWTDSFRGAVGGNDYLHDTAGLVWGMQMETWW
jgi:maltoporin